MATLYLIPTPIGDTAALDASIPAANLAVIGALDYFVVENVRTARRFLSRLRSEGLAGIAPIDSLHFTELNEHTDPDSVPELLAPALREGRDVGLMSEAGLPCVADPGALLVAAAHRAGLKVVPLTGASSIMLALMASGANGQSFTFNGYLPVKQPDRSRAIAHYERRARTEGQTQIFIEAPYRNTKLLEELTAACAPQTMLCVAADLLEPSQLILSRSIADWRAGQKKDGTPDLNKRPAIFILF